MSQFLESICCIDGKVLLLDLHQERVNRTFIEFFSAAQPHDLTGFITNVPSVGKFKCRVVYDSSSIEKSFIPYSNPLIESFEVVSCNTINYAYKCTDRSELNSLYSVRGDKDDILIDKQGMLTDGYFSNLAFYDGKKWFTPAQPLLKGVKRASLIAAGKLTERAIRTSDLNQFEKISFINAMLDLGEVTVDL